MKQLENIECPCCDAIATKDDWYALSNDDNAVCPNCDSYVGYDELGTDNEFYINK